jgi:xanthine dehydrogenase accessory factor
MDVFSELVRLRQERRACALCTVVRTSGSTPRKAAARMLVTAEGQIVGTIGGGRVEKEVTDAAVELLAQGGGARLLRYHLTHELAMCCGGEMEVFVEPLVPEPPLVICGSGHVAKALLPVVKSIGFAPVIVDDLEDLPPLDAKVIDSFDVRDWDVPLGDGTWVVIVTRDHAQDQALLEQLVVKDLAYLGLIGSRRKIEMFKQRLEARGVERARLDRVHAPIGLDIGAQTPEEIAVSIAAELIQVRARRRPSKEEK